MVEDRLLWLKVVETQAEAEVFGAAFAVESSLLWETLSYLSQNPRPQSWIAMMCPCQRLMH